MTKDESKASHVPAHDNKESRRPRRHQELGPTPQSSFKRETTPRGIQESKYASYFNGYFFSYTKFGYNSLDFISHARSVGSPNNMVRH